MPTFDIPTFLALIRNIFTGRIKRRGSGGKRAPYFFRIHQYVNGRWSNAGSETSPAKISKRLRKAQSSNAVGPLRVEVWESQTFWTGDEKPVEVFSAEEWLAQGHTKYSALL